MDLSNIGPDFDWSTMGATIGGMRDTGFEVWGFLIYRCTYGDDDAWSRYMTYLKEAVHENLDHLGRDYLLERYAQWTVIEDKDALDGASKQQVRERFVEWRDQHSISRELSEASHLARTLVPTPNDASARLPRFTYCLYVDQKCLDTLAAHAAAKAARTRPRPSLVAVVIDGDYPNQRPQLLADPDSDGYYPDVEGCTQKYVGWEYTSARYLAGLYDTLHQSRLDTPGDYQRPPAIYPAGLESM